MISKIKNIGKIVTWDLEKDSIDINENLEILIEDDCISRIGQDLNDDNPDNVIDARGGLVTPGFIDCHTHPIFSGDRSSDFKLRTEGKTYEDISLAGGGIKSSIKSVRESSKEELFKESLPRVEAFLKKGTTTIEAKSGYGLTLKDEIKTLEVIEKINESSNIDIVPTFMGAHDFPQEYIDNKDDYVDLICDKMIPEIADRKLAIFCDVFCEEGYFSVKQSEKILLKGIDYGLIPRLHADEFMYSGGAELAKELEAISAAHLMAVNNRGIDALANSNVISTLLLIRFLTG